jgi:hypothetical protein
MGVVSPTVADLGAVDRIAGASQAVEPIRAKTLKQRAMRSQECLTHEVIALAY